MKFFGKTSNIDFLKQRRLAFALSTLCILLTIISIVLHGGLHYGIDFAGGTLVQVKFKDTAPIQDIRDLFDDLNIGTGQIQQFGESNDVLINIQTSDNAQGEAVKQLKGGLVKRFGDASFSIERVEIVGPKVGKDLSTKAILALAYSLIGILIYVSYRFELRFALAAVAALAHDTIITVGAFSIADKEFTLPVIAALLTVIGYSLNDTIVVFDRIRENLRLKRSLPLFELANLSINQTIGRTIITSGTTLFVVIAIFIFGGSVIHDFSFAMLIGVVVGTYSSIFVASSILIAWPGTTTQTLSLAVKKK
ncbi:MAG: protein translocase subunit SecF [Nitrospinota bacterium]